MTKREENKLTMYKGTLTLLKAKSSKTETLPVFAGLVGQFESALEGIESRHRVHQSKAVGAAQQKELLEDEMIDSLVLLGSAMFVYGVQQKDEEIKTAVKVTESKLKAMRDTDLLQRARTLQTKATELAAALADYGINESTLTSLKDQIDSYKAALENKEMSTAEKTASRQDLSDAFYKADDILKQMIDPMMELFRSTDKELYNAYHSARVIKDL